MGSDCVSTCQYHLLISDIAAVDSLLAMNDFADGHTVFTLLHRGSWVENIRPRTITDCVCKGNISFKTKADLASLLFTAW